MPTAFNVPWGQPSTRPCRICSSQSTRSFERGGRDYLRCTRCDAITLDASREEYNALNPTYDPGPLSELDDPTALRTYLDIEGKKEFLAPLIAGMQRPCKVLDVGCGAGGYLLAAQELGCEAAGIEPSEEHSTLGRRLGLSIQTGYFSEGVFPKESFDLVLLSHVIEHIYEPRPFLESLIDLLRPGGKLVVVTPNAASIVAMLSGKWWTMLKPVDHVSMLGENSYRAMHLDGRGRLEFTQSEYPWEAAASLAAAGRDAVRALLARRRATPGAPAPAVATPSRASSSGLPWGSIWGRLRGALQLVGFPVHQLAVVQGRQACLVMTLTRT